MKQCSFRKKLIVFLTVAGLALSVRPEASSAETKPRTDCVRRLLHELSRAHLEPGMAEQEGFRAGLRTAERPLSEFQPEQRIRVTRRNSRGEAVRGKIRVLVDHPTADIHIIADFNDWGKKLTAADRLRPIPDTPYYEGDVRTLKHGMQYRLLVNGQEVFDPTSSTITTPQLFKKLTGREEDHLNSVFWDSERPGGYRFKAPSISLRDAPIVSAQLDLWGLPAKWPFRGRNGPATIGDTYRFIAESGIIDWLKHEGQYNSVRFNPFGPSIDGPGWRFHYLVINQYGVNSKFGTPDEFRQMIDAFHRAGIAVQADIVAAHVPTSGNWGIRSVTGTGALGWRKADGSTLYGAEQTEWGTVYFDFANPFVRRHLIEGVLTMLKEYNLDSLRLDHLDGIIRRKGGREFLRQLTGEIRKYKPEVVIEAEVFHHYPGLSHASDLGGLGIDFTTQAEYTLFIRNNLVRPITEIDTGELHTALHAPFNHGEFHKVFALTNQDEASLKYAPGMGAYPHDLTQNLGHEMSIRKIQSFGGLSMFSGSYYVDTPPVRLLQKGNFDDQPAVEWGARTQDDVIRNSRFFKTLSTYFKTEPAFAPQYLRRSIENHVDHQNKVVSLQRFDPQSGKHVYALVNLGDRQLLDYGFGVDRSANCKLVLDNHDQEFGGAARLRKALSQKASLTSDAQGMHGKAASLTLPIVEPYSFIVLELDP
ncbi:MAG: hypothetical protein A2428_16005 [Bdellovibrionales bacterium RIFOXYC1_FULL_54_43]|nr:MAG: hypothetical protein A2428_16005 [Bdellovibrionales bacterium RIFOXYC1_FULL_54_43]OFZ85166.1 MAG: hypothetical protein A2603_06340 [Bdellovibrionales bacterium RIFOXYD1_FULL_55_31]